MVKFISGILLTKHQREMIPFIKHHLLNYKEKGVSKDAHDDKVVEYLRLIIQNSKSTKLDERILKAINLSDENGDDAENVDFKKKKQKKNKTVEDL